MTASRRRLLASGLTGVAALGASSITLRAQESTPAPTTSGTPAGSTDRIVSHAAGQTTITGTPERIVALEWRQVEDVLALGIQPVGVADLAGYRQWVGIPTALAEDVADVGTTAEPGLESIAALAPDLILATTLRHEMIADQLATIAPTIVIPSQHPEGRTPLDHLRDTFLIVATALDCVAEAEALLRRLDEATIQGAATISAAGLQGAPYVAMLGFSSDQVSTMTVWTDDAIIGATISSLGLENAWRQEAADLFGSGYSQVTVEGFVDLPDDVVVFYQAQDTDNIFENQLRDDPIWSTLGFVQSGRLHRLPSDVWLDGGVLTTERLIDEIVTRLTGTTG